MRARYLLSRPDGSGCTISCGCGSTKVTSASMPAYPRPARTARNSTSRNKLANLRLPNSVPASAATIGAGPFARPMGFTGGARHTSAVQSKARLKSRRAKGNPATRIARNCVIFTERAAPGNRREARSFAARPCFDSAAAGGRKQAGRAALRRTPRLQPARKVPPKSTLKSARPACYIKP